MKTIFVGHNTIASFVKRNLKKNCLTVLKCLGHLKRHRECPVSFFCFFTFCFFFFLSSVLCVFFVVVVFFKIIMTSVG